MITGTLSFFLLAVFTMDSRVYANELFVHLYSRGLSPPGLFTPGTKPEVFLLRIDDFRLGRDTPLVLLPP